MALIAVATLAALSPSVCYADINQIGLLYRDILAQQGSNSPDVGNLTALSDTALREARPEEIEAVLPIAMKCLDSPNAAVRKAGMQLPFLIVLTRGDNATLLASYVRKIAFFLDDPDVGIKNSAITILSSGNPTPSPQALQYLKAHLGNRQNTSYQFTMIAAALMIPNPQDAKIVSEVLAAWRDRPDHESLTGGMVETLGQAKVTTSDALDLIRSELGSEKDYARVTALEAVRKMPKSVRDGFDAELRKLLADPSVDVRHAAEEVLKQ